MGASDWQYMVPYQDDLEAALDALRRTIFREGDFISPENEGLPVPESLSDLMYQEMYEEFMGTHGTHSIIDICHGVMPTDSGYQYEGTIQPLTDKESQYLFESAKPSRADFEATLRRQMKRN
jgi:hypothetical protein